MPHHHPSVTKHAGVMMNQPPPVHRPRIPTEHDPCNLLNAQKRCFSAWRNAYYNKQMQAIAEGGDNGQAGGV